MRTNETSGHGRIIFLEDVGLWASSEVIVKKGGLSDLYKYVHRTIRSRATNRIHAIASYDPSSSANTNNKE